MNIQIQPHCMAAATAAASDKLSEQDVLAAFSKIDEYRRQLQADGQMTGISDKVRKYAADQAQLTKIAAAAEKRRVALQQMAHHVNLDHIDQLVKQGMPRHAALQALYEGAGGKFAGVEGGRRSLWAEKQAYRSDYLGGMLAELEREAPHIKNIMDDPKLDADVTREMSELRKDGNPGVTGNKDAITLAKTFAKWAEYTRTELNKLGAAIGKLDGWFGTQSHDTVKMIRAGKDAWVGTIIGHGWLDVPRTFPGVGGEEAANILGEIYDTLITGMSNEKSAAEMGQRTGPANLANSLNKHRVLHFASPEAAMAYRDKFGYGNTISGMISHMERSAHMAALLKTMGPNPEVEFQQLTAELKRQAKEDPNLTDKQRVSQTKKLSTSAGALKAVFDIGTGLASIPAGDGKWAEIGTSIRSIERQAKLGMATFTSVPSDIATSGIAAQFRGSGFLKGVATQIGGLMRGRPRGEQAEIAYLTGQGFDGWIAHVMKGATGTDTARGMFGKMEERFFKWSGLTYTTDLARSVNGRTIAAEMGMRAKDAHADLNPAYRHVLAMNGIDEKRWEVIRQAPMRQSDGKPYMTHDLLRVLPDEAFSPLVQEKLDVARTTMQGPALAEREASLIAGARRDLELNVLRFFADETSYGVITPDAATGRWSTWGGLRPGTFGGEAARYVMQFKSTPIAFAQRTLARAAFGQRKNAGALTHARTIAALFTGLGLAGYMSMVMKDTMKGFWPPRDPSDPRTILAAFAQGGALGIYGDYLFASVNRFGGGPLESAIGPTLGTAGSIADIALDARDYAMSLGDNKFSGPRALTTAIGNTPYANLFFVKPALDYLILNSLREALAPGYLKKTAHDRVKQYGQQSVIPQAFGR